MTSVGPFCEPSALAIATLSYGPDYDRCQLLVESISRFSQTPVQHYLIVDQRDCAQFQSLANATTTIVAVESLLPGWIHRLSLIGKAWFSFKSPPIRNWILQQIVKLSFAESAPAPNIVFIDSDVAFVRPFDLAAFSRQGQLRLFRTPPAHIPDFAPLYAAAYHLLGLEEGQAGTVQPNYIGNLISWRRGNVKALRDRLECRWGRPWIETLARSRTLSEYLLYGVFVEQVLGDAAGHFYDCTPLCHEYWRPQSLNNQQLDDFFAALQPGHMAVMVSAKAGMHPSRYRPYLFHGQVMDTPLGNSQLAAE